MNIVGERIILRAIEEQDNEILLELINDPKTERMIGGYSYPISYKHQKDWFQSLNEKNVLRCMITDKNQPDISIGTVILSDIDMKNGTAEIHIKLTRNVRGKGYGTDAVNTMIKYAFDELRLNCIYSIIMEYNTASLKLFEKCGFQLEGRLRSRVYKNGHYADVYSYSKLCDGSSDS